MKISGIISQLNWEEESPNRYFSEISFWGSPCVKFSVIELEEGIWLVACYNTDSHIFWKGEAPSLCYAQDLCQDVFESFVKGFVQ